MTRDGFGCHSSGGGNVLSGCRAYDNSDDGFDFINAAGSCTVEMAFAFRNGCAGFKAGGYGSPLNVPSTGAATHTVRQCVAFGNRCTDLADDRVHDRCQQGRDVRVLRDWALISTASQRAKSLCSPGFLPVFVCTPVQTT
jgi:hypothetical protein